MEIKIYLMNRFNSLQTGKRIQRHRLWTEIEKIEICFNSLQTGKRIQSFQGSVLRHYRLFVSIPFKRESVSKEHLSQRPKWVLELGFNSLQTGKRIQRPTWAGTEKREGLSFNSLQTGKRIQRSPLQVSSFGSLYPFQFPSNGKAYPKFTSK